MVGEIIMTNIKLTSRDLDIIQFLKEFKIADTKTLQRLYFPSQSSCEKRLTKLADSRKIFRTRESTISIYNYYVSKPTNIKHSLLISDIYSRIATTEKLLKFKREYELKFKKDILRCDFMAVIQRGGKVVPVIIEIDLTKAYNNKYTQYIKSGHYKMLFPIEPVIVVISNRTPKSDIPVTWVKLSEL